MKKEVSYYLEDTSRLNEISQSELDAWIAEMPFHQPLQLLAGIKSEMSSASDLSGSKVHATYFAEDYEVILNGNGKSKAEKSKKDKKAKLLLASVESEAQNVQDIEREILKEDVNLPLPEISHSLADDVLEDTVVNEVLEELPEIETPKEISSTLADDVLEDSIINEVLEELTEIESPKEVSSSLADEVLEEEILSEILEENIEEIAESKTESIEEEIIETSEADLVIDSNEKEIESAEALQNTTDSIVDEHVQATTEEVVDLESEQIVDDLENATVELEDTPSEIETLENGITEQVEEIVVEDEVELTDSITENPEVSESEEEIPVVKKKKKKDRSKGKVSGKKAKKKKKSKKKKKVKYVIVDSSRSQKFKLNDYEGVSSYTSWLLEQKSINGKSENMAKAIKEMKNSKKKKKKKKKSKTLKIAVDSIKKQNSIISEPLADILAAQGHQKKARKMFEKLLLVFPEKAEYYREKIASLTKEKK